MKISKRDAQLLILLGLVLIGFAYYYFMYTPAQLDLQILADEKSMLEQQQGVVEAKFAAEKTLDLDLQKAQSVLSSASERYYGELFQELLVMTINELRQDSDLIVKGITFNEATAPLQELMAAFQEAIDMAAQSSQAVSTTPTETSTEAPAVAPPLDPSSGESAVTHVNTITALIQYEGYYTDLETFMYNLYRYPKQMVIQSVNITSDMDGYLTGVMAIEFHGMPKIGLVSEELQAYFQSPSKRESVTEVFQPYETFVLPEVPDLGDLDNGSITGENIEGSEVQIIEIERPTQLISSFEDFDYFFTGNQVDIVGTASRTVVRTTGNYGLKVQYNFVEPRKQNVANVVFDQKPLLVETPGVSLTLNAYAEGNVNHRIGAELVDATGKSYDITFAMSLQPSGWQTLEAPLPEEINYPFVVKRIFMEGSGLSQQLVAEIIFDELKIMLPDLGGVQ